MSRIEKQESSHGKRSRLSNRAVFVVDQQVQGPPAGDPCQELLLAHLATVGLAAAQATLQ